MRENIFVTKIFDWYRTIFSIGEIENQRLLQFAFGAILLSFLATFYRGWSPGTQLTVEAFKANASICWPYFPDCGTYYFLHQTPDGYSQHILFTGILCLMVFIVYRIYRSDWIGAHFGLTALWVFKILVTFVFAYNIAQNFDYFDIFEGALLLFFPHKLFFLRVGFVLIYFVSAALKFDDGWILGTYFTSLTLGLPLFSKTITPLITNFVIFIEVIGCWFLFSQRRLLQRTAFFIFLSFHIYSSLIINYRFPLLAIPLLIILFGLEFKAPQIPLDRKSIAGWTLLFLFAGLQCMRYFIPGDEKITLEGHRIGIYLFDANHQCVAKMIEHLSDGSTKRLRSESSIAYYRCDPYVYYFWAKQECARNPDILSIEWTFDHSANGGPFYRIIDMKNVCTLPRYKLFSHNSWIKLPAENPKIVGYPVENTYGI